MPVSRPIVSALTEKDQKAKIKAMNTLAVEFRELHSTIKEQTARADEIKDELREDVKLLGEQNEKDNFILKTDMFLFELCKREKISVNEMAAMKILEDKGLVEKATKLVVDGDAVRQLFISGLLTKKEVEKMLKSDVSYAFMTPKRLDELKD